MKKWQSAYLTYFDVFFEKLEYAVFLDEKLTYLTALGGIVLGPRQSSSLYTIYSNEEHNSRLHNMLKCWVGHTPGGSK